VNSDPETDWMLRLQTGDESGLTHILNRYETPVLNFVYKYIHNTDLAHDVTQDVFVELYRRRLKYKPTGKLSTYIFTIAAHRCLNLKRRLKKETPLEDQPDLAQLPPAKAMEVQELRRAIWDALALLPPKQRTALLLAKYDDMPLEDIARALKVSVGSVKQLLHRAKATLREKLIKYQP